MKGLNREAWLHVVADKLAPDFLSVGKPFPKLAISCGFPSKGATSSKQQRIGECWNGAACKDGTFQIFISPFISDGVRAADILVHELCHAVLPLGTKHNKTFANLAMSMGLEGKPTATVAGKALAERLNALVALVGPYPQSPLVHLGQSKTQSTRLLKVACEGCGYTVRVTDKWLKVGAPICPTCGVEMAAQS